MWTGRARPLLSRALRSALSADRGTGPHGGWATHGPLRARCFSRNPSALWTSHPRATSVTGSASSDGLVRSPWGSLPVPKDVTISDLLLSKFKEVPDKTALVDEATGMSLTYSQFGDKVRALAAGLAARGVRQGTIVSICAPNSVEMVLLLLAVPAAGGAAATMNSALTSDDLERLLDQSASEYLVTTPELLPKFANRTAMFKEVFTIGRVDGLQSVDDLVAASSPGDMPALAGTDPVTDPALIAFSSGTTSFPKGVLLSHYNMVAAVIAAGTPNTSWSFYSPDDVIVNMFPMAHIGGSVAAILTGLYSLVTIFLLNQYTFESYLEANQKHKATVMIIPPPVGVRLFNDPLVDDYDISSVKRALSGAAAISGNVQAGIYERLKLQSFRQVYGMTELTGVTHADDVFNFRYGSVGLPLPNVVAKIVDPESGEHLAPTCTGELYVQSPQVMLRYLHLPQETATIKDSDGWIRTGDIGYHDEDGFMYITDRNKDLIKVKGLQVAPAELEGALLGHPLVADAAVIGVPDERAGEVPRAFVVLVEGTSADITTERSITEYIADRVAPFKQLRGGVCFIETIPKLPSGKILRRVLREYNA